MTRGARAPRGDADSVALGATQRSSRAVSKAETGEGDAEECQGGGLRHGLVDDNSGWLRHGLVDDNIVELVERVLLSPLDGRDIGEPRKQQRLEPPPGPLPSSVKLWVTLPPPARVPTNVTLAITALFSSARSMESRSNAPPPVLVNRVMPFPILLKRAVLPGNRGSSVPKVANCSALRLSSVKPSSEYVNPWLSVPESACARLSKSMTAAGRSTDARARERARMISFMLLQFLSGLGDRALYKLEVPAYSLPALDGHGGGNDPGRTSADLTTVDRQVRTARELGICTLARCCSGVRRDWPPVGADLVAPRKAGRTGRTLTGPAPSAQASGSSASTHTLARSALDPAPCSSAGARA